MAWSVDPEATEATITSLLELVPRNPATAGTPGDWRSVRLETLSNDRNVDIVTEREPRDAVAGADSNQDPSNAQYVGQIAPHEKAGDDTLLNRRGLKIFDSGMHRDPLLSSRGFTVTRWAHCWVVLCVMIESPRAPGRHFALPILARCVSVQW